MKIDLVSFERLLVCALVWSAVSLDMSLWLSGVKLGNLFLLGVATLVLAYKVLIRGLDRGVLLTIYDIPLMLFIGLAFLSTLWSPSVTVTGFHSFLILVTFLSLYMLDRVDFWYLLRYVVVVGVLLCVFSLLLIPLYPAGAFQPVSSSGIPELRGVFDHQLRLGLFASLILGYMVLAYRDGRWASFIKSKKLYLFSMLLVSLVVVLAAARLYTFFAVLSLMLVIVAPRLGFLRSGYYLLASVFLLFFIFNSEIIFEFLDGKGVDATLTGRTLIWEKTLDMAYYKPIFGYGYASFGLDIFDGDWPWYRPPHPHNSFVQVFFELGYVGLIVTLLWVLSNFIEILLNYGRHASGPYVLFTFVVTFLGSFTGANYASKPSFLIILLFLMMFFTRADIKNGRSG